MTVDRPPPTSPARRPAKGHNSGRFTPMGGGHYTAARDSDGISQAVEGIREKPATYPDGRASHTATPCVSTTDRAHRATGQGAKAKRPRSAHPAQ
jgi:hypothetical protein